MFKIILSSWILLSSAAYAKSDVAFSKSAESGCASKGVAEATFGKEIYEKWSVWEPVHFEQPLPALESLIKKASSLGGNRIVITDVRPVYLSIRSTTHGSYASHTTNSFASVTIQGAVYACN